MAAANDNGTEKHITVRCNRLPFGELPVFRDEALNMSYMPPVFAVTAPTKEAVAKGLSDSITDFTKRCQPGDNLYAAITNLVELAPDRFTVEAALLAQAAELTFSSRGKKA
jgi:hypothetical protein